MTNKIKPENSGDILIVDDTLANLELLRILLVKAGYSVRGAINGQTAIMACKTKPPELILLDIIMPEMDGYDVCRKLKADNKTKDIPIIFISALDMLGDRVKGFTVGSVDYIAKPFQQEEVLARVSTHLQLYKMKMNLEQVVKERTSELEKSNVALANSEEKFRGLVENSSDCIWETNVQHQYTYASPNTIEILGYHPNEMIGKTLFDFMQKTETARVELIIQTVFSNKEPIKTLEKEFLHKNGQLVVIESSALPIIDENGCVRGYRGVDRDITERKDAEQKMSFIAEHDPITQLPNRCLFNKQFHQIIHRSSCEPRRVAMLIMDLDHFKDVNDTFGHQFGDQLLFLVAKRLFEVGKDVELLAHFGGDEFGFVLDNFDSIEEVNNLAEKLLNLIAPPFSVESTELFIGASIGISLYPDNGKEVVLLSRDADSALNLAKEKGRNNYQFYTDKLTQKVAERLSMSTRLRYAIQNNEFELYYQPQLELKTNLIIGAETLIRWQDPKLGLIPPDKFIPLAEETGLIIPIGEWVIREACKQFVQWRKKGNDLARISINVSGVQLERTDLPQLISDVLAEYQIQAACIDLEVTESMLMNNPLRVTKILQSLRDIGISLAIDDFGTGYSSLSYLKHFPVNTLKIDRSFIRDIPDNDDDMAITNAIVAMSKTLNLETLAEGVETKQHQDVLINLNCEYGQGFLFSKPVPADEFSKLLINGLPD